MSFEDYSGSPPKHGRIARLRGYLPPNDDASPMATHGQGTLSSLLKSRSSQSLQTLARRPSSFRGRETPEIDEEAGLGKVRRSSGGEDNGDFDFRRSDDRRLSAVLFGPQMRSQRLIGNSNPRYRWEQYWKTEEELKPMKRSL